ncbi:MAG TPA: SGNH/GDSL hydrolase family protein [Woeseiaceae bacterium]|nr:SGNH/GDSL hydrolase family protein [Woeseiaceae bacterium]
MLAVLASVLLGACAPVTQQASPEHEARWTAAWVSAPSPFLPGGRDAWLEPFTDVTVRQVLRVDASGSAVRVRFTNELGSEALHIGAASLARVPGGGDIAGPVTPLAFGGERGVRIPPGAMLLSDPVPLAVSRFDDLAVTVFFEAATRPTGHRHRVALSPEGDFTNVPVWPARTTVRGATAISGIEVSGAGAPRVLVAFGDSITEGAGATPGAHGDWPARLSRRIARRDLPGEWVIVNAGISGNRLLHDGGSQNGLARFARDALSVAGVTDIVVLLGINDLGVAWSPTEPRDVVDADDLVLAYRQLIDRAELQGVRLYGATILPYKGAVYFSPAGEAARTGVNAWIREGGAFDGIIDLDAVMRDPEDPERLRPDYEIGDSLHPNDAGYGAMAAAVEAFLRSIDD